MSLLIIILISLIRGHSAQGGPDRFGICKLYSFTNRFYSVLKYDVFGTSRFRLGFEIQKLFYFSKTI